MIHPLTRNGLVRDSSFGILLYFFALVGLFFPFLVFSDEMAEKPIITILDFQLSNVSKEEGTVIVDFLMSYIVETQDFRVIDRKERAAILEEIEFSVSDCTDEDCQIHIGQLLSANQIIVGSFGRVEDRCILNIKLLDVQTGETIRTKSEKYKSMNTLIDDSKRLILDFIKGELQDSKDIVIIRKTKDELEAVPEMEQASKKEKLFSLLSNREYRDKNRIMEIQDLSTYLYDFEKPVLYRQYKVSGAAWAALGNTFLGIGSWIQGDGWGGFAVTGLMLGGFLILLNSDGDGSAGLGNMCMTVGLLSGWIIPFIYQGNSNKRLKKALLIDY